MAENTSTFKESAEIFSEEMMNVILPVTIFVGLEAVLGFFGNLIVLYVFLFRYHNCNFRYFVLSLGCVDITSSLTTIPAEIVTQLYWYSYPYPLICKIKSFFNILTVCAETLCLLLIAVDRYRKVCSPLRWQIQHRQALRMCFAIFAASFVLAIPAAILWGTHSYEKTFNEEFNSAVTVTVTVCERDQQYLNSYFPLAYIISTYTLASVCLFVMLFLYVSIVRTLFKGKSRSKGPISKLTTSPSAREQDVENNMKADASDFECQSNTDTGSKLSDSISSGLNGIQNYGIQMHVVRTTFSVPQSRTSRVKLNAAKDCSGRNTAEILYRKTDARTRLRGKTRIMFVLTVVFIVTSILYFTMAALIADGVLENLTDSGKTIYFFFFRLYFINHVINPMLYASLDPQFRKAMHSISSSRITATSQT